MAARKMMLGGNEKESVPQGLKPDVFSMIYGPTKVVP
jgi:hypothetical protein